MFSSNSNGEPQSGSGLGPTSGGIPHSKSLLSSFLFSRLSSQNQQQQEQDCHRQPRSHQPLSLHSNLLPQSLLGDGIHDKKGALRSRTVTEDTTSTEASYRNSSIILPPPFRTWSIVSDDHMALPKVPCHYPPFDPNCTALVTDAPPSIVIVRISECLRRRSIAVEYDDESVTARCMTVDRVHFIIQLYRVPVSPRNETTSRTLDPPHDAVIVEVRKIAGGSGMSFHVACSKILLAAKGLDTGDDERPPHRRNGIEFRPRSIAKRKHPFTVVSSSRIRKRRKMPLLDDEKAGSFDRSVIAEQSFGQAVELLQKDRLECQQLGMERLVNLTNNDSVGNEICAFVSRRLLLQEHQEPNHSGVKEDNKSSGRWKLIDCLVHPGAEQALGLFPDAEDELVRRSSPTNISRRKETKNDQLVRSFLESPALTAVTPLSKTKSQPHHRHHHSIASSLARGTSFLKKRSLRRADTDLQHHGHGNGNAMMSSDELKHEAKLRSLALRVFCNALENLSKTKELPEILHCPPTNSPFTSRTTGSQTSGWAKPAFLLSLVQDLQGAARPPSISETSYKLASVHEAALAARCLRLLAGYESDENNEEEEDTHHQQHQHQQPSDFVVEQEALRDFLRSQAVLERLDYARSCGRAAHAMLHYEAELTYNKLTEDDRSC